MMHQRSTARIMRAVALTALLVILSVLVRNCLRPLTAWHKPPLPAGIKSHAAMA